MFQNSFLQQAENATRYSIDGLKFLLKSEFAARIEVYCFLWLFPFLVFFDLPTILILSTLIIFLLLLATEALNTAIEVIVDRVSPEISDMGKQAKDLGSFAVMAVLLINIIHLFYAFTRLDFSKFEWGKTLFVSIVFFLLGLYLAVDKLPRKKWKYAVTFVAGGYIIGTGIYVASNYFTGVGFDSKVIYHLKTGLTGAGFGEYSGLMIWMSVYVLAGAIFTYFVADLLGRKGRSASKFLTWFRHRELTFGRGRTDVKKEKSGFGLAQMFAAASVLGFSVILNPFSQDVFELVRTERISSAKITEVEFYSQPDNIKLLRKRNIVFVYLESLERTYFDQDIFPNLVPNLSALERENISFTEMQYSYHTEWTIAGLLSTQCGVPLYTSSNGNAMDAYDAFMPNALCMGDIFKKNGYDLTFMNGADTRFAGKDKFFKTHGFDTILGKSEHKQNLENEGLYSQWGLHDDRLLDIAFETYLDKSALRKPFGLFVLTVDTHHPKGHVSNSCDGVTYQDGSNQMLNAVKCSDIIVNDFVKKIQQSDYAKDTIIVLMSDHMAMKNQAHSLLKMGKRRNFFTIIDPYTRAPLQISRAASSMDVAPTVLSLFGFDSEALGFGRNLLGGMPTLMEEKGGGVNHFLISMKKKMQADLWEFPALSGGISFDMVDKSIKIADRSFETPVMIILDEDNRISDFKFFKSKTREQDKYFEKAESVSNRFLWVDRCEVMARHLPTIHDNVASNDNSDSFCAVSKVDGQLNENTLTETGPIFTDLFEVP